MSFLMAITIVNQQNSECLMKQDQSETNATFGSGIMIIKTKANLGKRIVENSKLILVLTPMKFQKMENLLTPAQSDLMLSLWVVAFKLIAMVILLEYGIMKQMIGRNVIRPRIVLKNMVLTHSLVRVRQKMVCNWDTLILEKPVSEAFLRVFTQWNHGMIQKFLGNGQMDAKSSSPQKLATHMSYQTKETTFNLVI
jgi:hypothetical protein